jgi:hypothetical protein
MEYPVTRDKFLEYVATLPIGTRGFFYVASAHVDETTDTLSKEFQIAAAILNVFEERAAQWVENH